jgi:hypothetical protein
VYILFLASYFDKIWFFTVDTYVRNVLVSCDLHIWTWEAEGRKFHSIIFANLRHIAQNFKIFQVQMAVIPNTVPV